MICAQMTTKGFWASATCLQAPHIWGLLALVLAFVTVVQRISILRKYIPKRKGEYPETLCTDTNAWNKLGWKPKKSIKKYISEWLEENGQIK